MIRLEAGYRPRNASSGSNSKLETQNPKLSSGAAAQKKNEQ
jgi:hypothetical protein